MNHLPLLVFSFVVIVNLSLTGANTRIPRSNYYAPPPPPYEDVVTNIGNGSGRRNVFQISENPSNVAHTQSNRQPALNNKFGDGSYPANPPAPPPRLNNYGNGDRQPALNNKFGDGPYPANPSAPPPRLNNYGNGDHNRNTYNLNTRGRTQPTQSSGYNGGTSFTAGSSTFHVGYGTNNQNFINGKPVPAANNGGRPQHQNFGSGVPNFAPRTDTVNNLGIGKNNRNAVNFKGSPNEPVLGNDGGRNPPLQSNIDRAYVNGVPIQPDHVSPTGFRTYNLPSHTVSVLSNPDVSRPPTNFDAQHVTKLRALSSQLQGISDQLSQEAARHNVRL